MYKIPSPSKNNTISSINNNLLFEKLNCIASSFG